MLPFSHSQHPCRILSSHTGPCQPCWTRYRSLLRGCRATCQGFPIQSSPSLAASAVTATQFLCPHSSRPAFAPVLGIANIAESRGQAPKGSFLGCLLARSAAAWFPRGLVELAPATRTLLPSGAAKPPPRHGGSSTAGPPWALLASLSPASLMPMMTPLPPICAPSRGGTLVLQEGPSPSPAFGQQGRAAELAPSALPVGVGGISCGAWSEGGAPGRVGEAALPRPRSHLVDVHRGDGGRRDGRVAGRVGQGLAGADGELLLLAQGDHLLRHCKRRRGSGARPGGSFPRGPSPAVSYSQSLGLALGKSNP